MLCPGAVVLWSCTYSLTLSGHYWSPCMSTLSKLPSKLPGQGLRSHLTARCRGGQDLPPSPFPYWHKYGQTKADGAFGLILNMLNMFQWQLLLRKKFYNWRIDSFLKGLLFREMQRQVGLIWKQHCCYSPSNSGITLIYVIVAPNSFYWEGVCDPLANQLLNSKKSNKLIVLPGSSIHVIPYKRHVPSVNKTQIRPTGSPPQRNLFFCFSSLTPPFLERGSSCIINSSFLPNLFKAPNMTPCPCCFALPSKSLYLFI